MAGLAGLGLLAAPPAQAAVIITMLETGSGVTVTGSGKVNLASLVRVDFTIGVSSITPGGGLVTAGGPVDLYEPVNGPGQYGGDGSPIFATSSSGTAFGIGILGVVAVPQGYVSGDEISFTMDFAGQTLSSLTVVEGTYVWSWGRGDTFDTVTLRIGQTAAAVAEPASALLLGVGLLGLAGLRRRPA